MGSDTKAHVLAVSYPIQGHVTPLMKFSKKLTKHGIKVTFIVTEFVYSRMLASGWSELSQDCLLRLVAVPDGLEPEDDRSDERKVGASIYSVLPSYLEKYIADMNHCEEDTPFTCLVADITFGWALGIARKIGITAAMFWPSSPGALELALRIPELIEAGIISNDGIVMKDEKFGLSSDMPPISPSEFTWNCPGDLTTRIQMFVYIQSIIQTKDVADYTLCNWFHDLDPKSANLVPNLLTVGPFTVDDPLVGNLFREDLTCLTWLDKQLPESVIYIAFGSSSKFSQEQFDELALALELTGRPFLWVVRSDPTGDPAQFRFGELGKIVEWAPQEKVLAHPSVGCFVSHCGWNSTMEGISTGVPFLCWPYFSDQLYNRRCVCDGWKIGHCFDDVADGEVITKDEIKKKLEDVLSDEVVRGNSLKLKEVAMRSVSDGGSSSENFNVFLEQLKCCGTK